MSADGDDEAMDDVQLGRRFRALRHRLNLRQVELAERAGVSRDVISLMERGRIERVTVRRIRRIARELGAEFQAGLWWRAGDLDRLVDEGHARLVGLITEMLQTDGWEVRLEVSYAIYRERGSIDVLAWHPQARILLVIEVKTDLVVVEETLRKHDEKARLAPKIAAEQFGYRPIAVARVLVLPSRSTQRRRVDRHAAVMNAAYPLRGVGIRRWLSNPSGPAAGLLFAELERAGPKRVALSRKRIRRPRQVTAEAA
jgi:transcriptional regulator with XRE-family HTH domain